MQVLFGLTHNIISEQEKTWKRNSLWDPIEKKKYIVI